jgi:acyl-CoA thioesterase I
MSGIGSRARRWQRSFAAALLLFSMIACGKTEPPAPSPLASKAPEAPLPVVLCVGTSLTAGYGLDVEQAYPALLQQKIAQAGLRYHVQNAGISGETSAGALHRIDWLLRQPVAVFVLETGANDGLRAQDPAFTRNNIQQILDRVKKAAPPPKVLLVGIQAPPNYGAAYTAKFGKLYPDLAEANHVALVPFLLEGVAGIPALNQADGIHPTAEGQRIVADTVWKALRPLL